MAERKVKGFKKFSEMKKSNKDIEEVSPEIVPDVDQDRPAMPNHVDQSKKVEKFKSRKNIIPKEQNVELGKTETEKTEDETNEKVDFIGKVAKFPNRTKASKALNFLENVKISKNSIWYILVEKQSNELQMLKYNNNKGVDMERFVLELKGYYLRKYQKNERLVKLIENIEVKGAPEFSAIRNIPNIEIEKGKKMITKITEDLLKLLSN